MIRFDCCDTIRPNTVGISITPGLSFLSEFLVFAGVVPRLSDPGTEDYVEGTAGNIDSCCCEEDDTPRRLRRLDW